VWRFPALAHSLLRCPGCRSEYGSEKEQDRSDRSWLHLDHSPSPCLDVPGQGSASTELHSHQPQAL